MGRSQVELRDLACGLERQGFVDEDGAVGDHSLGAAPLEPAQQLTLRERRARTPPHHQQRPLAPLRVRLRHDRDAGAGGGVERSVIAT